MNSRSLATVVIVLMAWAVPAHAHADVTTVWNQQVVTSGGPQTQRTFAMVHLAMFDAVNAIEGGFRPYLSLPAPPPGASAEAAAASAARGVLLRLFPAQQAALDALLASSLAGIPDGPSKTDGVAFGDLAAQAIYDARANDNMLAPGPPFVNGTEPGAYRLTTPGPPQPVNTGARSWLPFAMRSASQFRPGPPPSLQSWSYARDFNLTALWGSAATTVRSADQDEIARWHTEQAQFQFNRIARAELAADGRGLLAHARLFALLNLALADATTAVFDAKYTYLFWRPSTAIQNADADDNRRTDQDATWAPFLTTPPHPEYPAAHGAVQGAGMVVLSAYLGPRYAFDTTSPTVPGVTRHYESVAQFAFEGAAARVFGGMHFVNSLVVGSRQGLAVGAWVLDRFLRPVRRH